MWSTGYSAHRLCEPASTAPLFLGTAGSGNGELRAAGGLDTLLGPEETGVSPVASDCGTRDRITVPVVRFWWARLFFENCTVDASISGGQRELGVGDREVSGFGLLLFVSAICFDRFVCSSF